MQTTLTNPCIRCGKERIISKTWTEKIGNAFLLTRTDTVCPDTACQKVIDEEFAAQIEKKNNITLKRLKDKEERAKSQKIHT